MHPRCHRCIYLSFTFRFSRAWKWYSDSMNRRTLIKNNRTLFLFPSSFRVHMSRSINEYYYENKDNKHASMHWRKIVFPRALLSPPAKKKRSRPPWNSQTIFFLLFQDHVHVSVTQKIIQLRNSTCETERDFLLGSNKFLYFSIERCLTLTARRHHHHQWPQAQTNGAAKWK